MDRKPFKDYYKLLQVHFEASPEVIKAAYIKLSKAYHPDSAIAIKSGLSELNEAFDVLKDPVSRNKYHQKWLEHYTGIQSVKDLLRQGVVPSEISVQAAKDVLDLFFRYICIREWDGAYQLLTAYDRSRTALEDFAAWRESVALCSMITSYDIRYSRAVRNCTLEGITYSDAVEFNMTITECSSSTGECSTAAVKKICVFDGLSWRIVLGVSNLKASAMRFRLEAEHSSTIDAMALYHSAAARIDPLTGLLSESGLLDEFEREIERSRRYSTPITVIGFCVRPADRSKETACLCRFASIIQNSKRKTDIAARLNNDVIICLLTETRKISGELAAKKFLKLIEKKQDSDYNVTYSVVSYTGKAEASETIRTAAEMAVSTSH